MNEIKKYLDFVFKDFPETKEIITEKNRLQNYLEDIYNDKVSDGMPKVDALKATLDSAGNIRELHKKYKVSKDRSLYRQREAVKDQLQRGSKIHSGRLAFLFILFFCIAIFLISILVIK